MSKVQTANTDLVEHFIARALNGQIDDVTRKRVEKFLAQSEGDFKLVLKSLVEFVLGDWK